MTAARLNCLSVGVYQALGYRFEIRLTGYPSVLRGPIRQLFEGLECPDPSGEAVTHVYLLIGGPEESDFVRIERDGYLAGAQVTAWQAVEILVGDLNQQVIASRANRFVAHAGAVSYQGRGILLPGLSGAGKSTITAALVARGCEYLSDEAVPVDFDTLYMEPYPKPLSLSKSSMEGLRRDPHPVGPVDLVPAPWLRTRPWGSPVPPRFLVFPRYEPSAPAGISEISRGEALVELANNSFNFKSQGRDWLPGLRRIVMSCSCWRLSVRDALLAAATVVDIVEASASQADGRGIDEECSV